MSRSHPYYLYILECEGFFKIGIAKTPMDRMKVISTSTPFEVNFVSQIGFDWREESKLAETMAHEYLTELGLHKKLEWFSCTKEQAIAVCEECSSSAIKIRSLKISEKRSKALKMLSLFDFGVVSEVTGISTDRVVEIVNSQDIKDYEATRIIKIKEFI